MLELSSPRWRELDDAYGTAESVPELLRQLAALPADEGDSDPWFRLWSALAHQGDVFSASFAAVPHVITALASSPGTASETYFHFPAWIEICRHKNAVEIPDDLREAYFEALDRIPALVAKASDREWDASFTACVLSAVAAAKGHHELAEALLEMTSAETPKEFLEWFYDR